MPTAILEGFLYLLFSLHLVVWLISPHPWKRSLVRDANTMPGI